MLHLLFQVDYSTYLYIMYAWGTMAVAISYLLWITKQLPMSTRIENKVLDFWGYMDKKAGWMIMETPILNVVIYCFTTGKYSQNLANMLVIAPFILHYIHRAIIFPHRMDNHGKKLLVFSVVASFFFYIINGYFVGYYIGHLRQYPDDWIKDPRFIIGLMLMIAGFYINVTSDSILINLRKPGETGYKIPKGGVFKFVSCPHYFGEIVEWVGFALLSWSTLGVVYLIWVTLPLFCQGIGIHKWYLEKFKDEYPALKRKAVVPFIL